MKYRALIKMNKQQQRKLHQLTKSSVIILNYKVKNHLNSTTYSCINYFKRYTDSSDVYIQMFTSLFVFNLI